MASDALTWLHLSDLHFGHGGARDRIDQETICTAILADAEVMRGELGPPDWIFVTGDIAFKGAPEEYRKASAWLEQLAQKVGINHERILLVPGNHDVDRALVTGKPSARILHEHLRTHPEALDDFFSDPAAIEALWSKLAAYADFAKTILIRTETQPISSNR
jgi:predicted MPP superfamily phosphohydrolase